MGVHCISWIVETDEPLNPTFNVDMHEKIDNVITKISSRLNFHLLLGKATSERVVGSLVFIQM